MQKKIIFWEAEINKKLKKGKIVWHFHERPRREHWTLREEKAANYIPKE